VVIGMRHVRNDEAFTLTELLVVISLLSMVLVVVYSALQLTFRAADVQKRDSFISTSITEPIQVMDVVLSQNLSIDAGSGDYMLSCLTDQDADNAKERHVFQATDDGRLLETVYTVGANDVNTGMRRSTVWDRALEDPDSMNTNVSSGSPLFSCYKVDELGVRTPTTPDEGHRECDRGKRAMTR
jgi:prepilin-type N-terminal cleavage/methylation domain-containing protein